MILCDNWSQLVGEAQNACRDILEDDVAPVATKILKKHIKTDIYDAYTPKTNGWVVMRGKKRIRQTYQRRNDLSADLFYIVNKDKELTVSSNSNPMPPITGAKIRFNGYGSLLYLLESADMGLWRGGFPRPAVTNAQKEINESAAIANAINHGLSKRF